MKNQVGYMATSFPWDLELDLIVRFYHVQDGILINIKEKERWNMFCGMEK